MVVSWIIKKEAMGEADIIIAGIIGAVLGVKLGLGAIYISAVIALPVFMVIKKRDFELPFIPFWGLGLFISWLADEEDFRTLWGQDFNGASQSKKAGIFLHSHPFIFPYSKVSGINLL